MRGVVERIRGCAQAQRGQWQDRRKRIWDLNARRLPDLARVADRGGHVHHLGWGSRPTLNAGWGGPTLAELGEGFVASRMRCGERRRLVRMAGPVE